MYMDHPQALRVCDNALYDGRSAAGVTESECIHNEVYWVHEFCDGPMHVMANKDHMPACKRRTSPVSLVKPLQAFR